MSCYWLVKTDCSAEITKILTNILKGNTCNNSTNCVLEIRLHPVLSQTFVMGCMGESMSIVGRVRGLWPGGEWKLLFCACVCVRACEGGVQRGGRERETAWVAILLRYYPSCRALIRHEGHR